MGEVEARFRPQIRAPHGCEPLGALNYPIGWIEWPDYEANLEWGSVKRPISVQSPIDVDQTALSRTRHVERPASWAGKSSNSIVMNRIVDKTAEVSGAVYVTEVYGEAGGEGGGCRRPGAALGRVPLGNAKNTHAHADRCTKTSKLDKSTIINTA